MGLGQIDPLTGYQLWRLLAFTHSHFVSVFVIKPRSQRMNAFEASGRPRQPRVRRDCECSRATTTRALAERAPAERNENERGTLVIFIPRGGRIYAAAPSSSLPPTYLSPTDTELLEYGAWSAQHVENKTRSIHGTHEYHRSQERQEVELQAEPTNRTTTSCDQLQVEPLRASVQHLTYKLKLQTEQQHLAINYK